MSGPVLDHVFVFVPREETEPGGGLRARLDALGLAPSYSRRHAGQGTANLCYVFDNAYLELLFVVEPAEMDLPAVSRAGLGRRARWRGTGASPVGVGLRGGFPFPAWAYRFDGLPPGLSIPVALDSDDPVQPFVFGSPGTAAPVDWTDGRAGRRQRDAGFTDIAAVRIDGPAAVAPAPALRSLSESGVIVLGSAGGHGLRLTLARTDGGTVDLALL